MKQSVFVIAEGGVNHNGDLKLAFELVDAAVEAKADAVKFQSFKTEDLIVRNAPKADYQKKTTGTVESQFEMLKKLELSFEAQRELRSYCQRRGILFFSTPFDLGSLRFLINELDTPYLKVASGEISNAPLLLEMGRARRPVILSTGLSTIADVQEALEIIAYGLLQKTDTPTRDLMRLAFVQPETQSLLRSYVSVLHCVSEYPAPFDHVNLRCIHTLSQTFGLKVGYSDHTPGWSATVAAVALGAVIIEKHLTTDKSLPGPDHLASLDPTEFKSMVTAIRETEAALGSSVKLPCPVELRNKSVAQKSVVASKAIAVGEKFSEHNLTVKRPAGGLSPKELWNLFGKASTGNFAADDLIKL